MARKRDVNPDLWTDEKIQNLPWSAVGFYIGLISQADDEGRLEWSTTQLAARIVGLRDDVTLADVRGWMDRVVEVGLVETYELGGRRYAWHPRWKRHQYVNRPQASRLPQPPLTDGSVSPPAALRETQVPPGPGPHPGLKPSPSESPEVVPVADVRLTHALEVWNKYRDPDQPAVDVERPVSASRQRQLASFLDALGDDHLFAQAVQAFAASPEHNGTASFSGGRAEPRPLWTMLDRPDRWLDAALVSARRPLAAPGDAA